MSESWKAILTVILIGCILASVLVWFNDHSSWRSRAGFPLAGAVVLSVILWSLLRRDREPDFLRQLTRGYFERTGFCFTLVPKKHEGLCVLNLFFQNRYTKACRAQVAIQPSQGFFLTRPDLTSLVLGIKCDGGAFGVVRIPWPVARKYQGTAQSLDVAAKVKYPLWRGRMLRFQDGMHVGKAHVGTWTAALTLAGAFAGMIVMIKPARIKFTLPTGVAEEVPDDAPIVQQTLWRPGDPTEDVLARIL